MAFEERWLRQVVLDILANALRASPSGGLITLRSEFVPRYRRVSIEGDEPGLTVDQCERAFERFVRFHQRGEEDRGSGLRVVFEQPASDERVQNLV